MEEYRVSLSQFEGPLDLLLHLIEKAEVNIEDIFVSEITSQYLAMMDDLSELDMDRASSFLTVAAQLLLIKSRSLLPRPPAAETDEEDPQEQLIRQLREYKAFKTASEELHARFEEAKKSFSRLPEDVVLPPQKIDIANATLDNLYAAFLSILRGASARQTQRGAYPVRRAVFRHELAHGADRDVHGASRNACARGSAHHAGRDVRSDLYPREASDRKRPRSGLHG